MSVPEAGSIVASVTNADDATVRSWTATSVAGANALSWDGQANDGAYVPDGDYTPALHGPRPAGQRTAPARPGSCAPSASSSSVKTSAKVFYPHDADRFAKTINLSFALARPATVTWTIRNAANDVVVDASRRRGGRRRHADLGLGRPDRCAASSCRAGSTPRYVSATDGTWSISQSVRVEMNAFAIATSTATPRRGGKVTVIVTSAEPLSGGIRLYVTQPGKTTWGVTMTKVDSRTWRGDLHAQDRRHGRHAQAQGLGPRRRRPRPVDDPDAAAELIAAGLTGARASEPSRGTVPDRTRPHRTAPHRTIDRLSGARAGSMVERRPVHRTTCLRPAPRRSRRPARRRVVAKRTAVASGFRRSLARHGARTIAARSRSSRRPGQLVRPRTASRRAIAATRRRGRRRSGRAAQLGRANGPGPRPTVAARRSRPPSMRAGRRTIPSTPAAAADAGGLQPSIQYEEAERTPRTRSPSRPAAASPSASRRGPAIAGRSATSAPTPLPAGRLDGSDDPRSGRRAGRVDAGRGTVTPPAGAATHPADSTSTSRRRDGRPSAATAARFSGAPGSTATDPEIRPEAAISQNGLRREIFGFLPYWEVNSSCAPARLQRRSRRSPTSASGPTAPATSRSATPTARPTVGWSGWTSSKMTSIISAAHASHTRVVLTVQSFGWNTSGPDPPEGAPRLGDAPPEPRQADRRGGPRSRRRRRQPRLRAARRRRYDAEFTALVRTIRTELNKIHRGYQITFDTTGSIGNYPIADATAPGGADAIFIMGYDYRTSARARSARSRRSTGPATTSATRSPPTGARVAPRS